MATDVDVLARRVRHLMHEMRLGAARWNRLRPAWATAKIVVFDVTTTAARLRALVRARDDDAERLIHAIGDPVVEQSLRATAAMPNAPVCESRLTVAFDEPLLSLDAPAGERIAQWIARTTFLVEHEGLRGDLRVALTSTWPIFELTRQYGPMPNAYLLYELPRRPAGNERDAIVYLLQCQNQCGADLTMDAETIEAIAAQKLEAYPPFLRDTPIYIVDDLHARGLISDEVAAAARADAVDAPQAR